MLQRNLLYKEVQSLQNQEELELEVTKKPVIGHVAWAKNVLNSLYGSSLSDDNQVDQQLKTALAKFQAATNLPQTSKLDFRTERALLERNALSKLSIWDIQKRQILFQAKTRIEDWTHKAVIPEKKKKLILNQFRDPRLISSLVLHHMAYKRADSKGQYSNPEKYLAVGAHFCIMLDGRIMQHHPISRFIWHSNCTSPRSVGVEFEGNFPDISGKWWYPTDQKTKKKIKINEDTPTSAQYEAGRFLLSYLKLVLDLKHVLAHRQSSNTRVNDPGPAIWYNVAEWGIDKLGLGDGGKDFKCGTGKPILPQWRSGKIK
ncbi:peptidoglycan recognition protein family protein [Pontibacter beigongshangensis]|uniref:peptidoglycan recognition protein family protein n=1 Tax=Pontibacter beigongshangensis TaxID=2574733 RepID=UPI001650045B|nr:peptidoglycan recognition family protein [Pontibacter beigongshangensis]